MSTETDAEIVATCEMAVTYLGEHGLGRGAFVDDRGRACAAGALALGHFALHGGVICYSSGLAAAMLRCPAVPAVAAVIREQYPARIPVDAGDHDPSMIFAFNDHSRTTQDEVVEVLRETIKRHTPDEYTSAPADQP